MRQRPAAAAEPAAATQPFSATRKQAEPVPHLDRFRQMLSQIQSERGGVVLFGLFEREDSPQKWDLVISAPWVVPNRKAAVDGIVIRLHTLFKPEELTFLSRVIALSPTDGFVLQVTGALGVTGGAVTHVQDSWFNGMVLHNAVILQSDYEAIDNHNQEPQQKPSERGCAPKVMRCNSLQIPRNSILMSLNIMTAGYPSRFSFHPRVRPCLPRRQSRLRCFDALTPQ
jgi:hypothetical protein